MNTNDDFIKSAPKADYTVALIDSDEALNHTIADKLRAIGCTVLQAFTSEEIPQIVSQNPDFIVIDPIYDACDEAMLREYLSRTEGAGIIIFSSDKDPKRREYLFESGILEYISKDEPLEEVGDELIHLFETIKNNASYRVTMIAASDPSQQRFKQLVLHRGYQLCILNQCSELLEKWDHSDHELPDLLILDLTINDNIKKTFELVHYIRVNRLSEIPIILILNEEEAHFSSKFYRAGANSILIPPYSCEKFLSKVTHHLDYQVNKIWLKHEHSLSAQLKTMIDSSSIVSKADTKGVITYVNAQFCQITGYTSKELIGKPHSIIRHPDNSPMFFEQMWKTIQNKKIFHGMIKNRRKNGTTYYVDTTISPIVDDNDTIIEYISIRHDVTPLIEKQHEIEDQRRRTQNVLDAQTSLICMVDKAKGVIHSNRGFKEFLGITSLDPNERGFVQLSDLFLDAEDLFHVSAGERFVCLDRLYAMKGQLIKVAMKDRFFNHHVFSVHVEKIQDNNFTTGICYLVSFEDITQLNRALREAKASSEAESRFLATMSHEIRTPLNGILGFAELLGETPLDEQQRKYLTTIEYSGETLRQIINDILDVMKFDREQLELNFESVNLIGEIEAMVYPFYAQAAKKGVDLLIFIDPKLPASIQTDVLRFKQILINLISNAIKFTPSGKNVYVRIKKIRTANGKVTISISVADEGIGVKPEHKDQIFKAFVQADNTIAREFGGTGLGLNIVTRVITAMDGKIALKSIYGKGSVFNVSLELDYNIQRPDYECQRHITHLYLPRPNPSKRFLLVERYLKRFACCDSHLYRSTTLEGLNDDSDLHIVLFSDMMSAEEIQNTWQRFSHAKIFVIPSIIATAPTTISADNVIYLSEEISWSTIANRLEIDDHHIAAEPEEQTSVSYNDLRILVAEDNEVNQFYIQELLNKLHILHELAHDGYQAVKKFIEGRYDLVLMDINMPNMDGITAAQQILQYEQETGAPHTPIIGLSADAVAKNITHYLSQGLDGYLVKPLRKSDLTTLLNGYFSSHAVIHHHEPAVETEPTVSTGKSLTAHVASKVELPAEIVAELFKKFISNSQVILTQIDQYHNDPQALKMSIHSLKGISKNLYLERLGDLCETFENDLPSLSQEERANRLQGIKEETGKTILQMKEELI